jgi:hypothetical protein
LHTVEPYAFEGLNKEAMNPTLEKRIEDTINLPVDEAKMTAGYGGGLSGGGSSS